MKRVAAGLIVLLCHGIVGAQQGPGAANKEPTPESLRAEIEALRPARIAWRQIQWKSCLLEALAESRAKNKPVLLWLVGPGDGLDGRC